MGKERWESGVVVMSERERERERERESERERERENELYVAWRSSERVMV